MVYSEKPKGKAFPFNSQHINGLMSSMPHNER